MNTIHKRECESIAHKMPIHFDTVREETCKEDRGVGDIVMRY